MWPDHKFEYREYLLKYSRALTTPAQDIRRVEYDFTNVHESIFVLCKQEIIKM